MRRTAEEYARAYCAALDDAGFDGAFIREHAAALEPFFGALERADGAALFAPDSAAARGAFLAALYPPAQAAAATACRAAFAVLDRRIAPQPPPAEKPKRKKKRAAAKKEKPAPTPPAPVPSLDGPYVQAALKKLRESDAFLQWERRRLSLFAEDRPPSAEALRFAAEACGQELPDPRRAAELLARADPAGVAASGSVRRLESLAPCFAPPAAPAGALAASLCRCYRPRAYPVWNAAAVAALRFFRDWGGFYPFLNGDLEDYAQYKRVLQLFRQRYALQDLSLSDTALWLEDFGRTLSLEKEEIK